MHKMKHIWSFPTVISLHIKIHVSTGFVLTRHCWMELRTLFIYLEASFALRPSDVDENI